MGFDSTRFISTFRGSAWRGFTPGAALPIVLGLIVFSSNALGAISTPASIQDRHPSSTRSDTLTIREALAVTLPRRTITNVIANTPLDAWFVNGPRRTPGDGEPVRFADGTEAKWQRILAGEDGWFEDVAPEERFVAVTLNRESAGRMILQGMGHDIVYVNGTPRVGNPYQQKEERESWEPSIDYSRIPIELRRGENLLLFRYSRGRLKIKLFEPVRPVMLVGNDATLPDAVLGESLDAWGSILVVNATPGERRDLALVCAPDGGTPDTAKVPPVPASGVRKAAFRIRLPSRRAPGDVGLRLTLLSGGVSGGAASTATADTTSIPLHVVGSADVRKETFISSIDGSVQYYAVLPQRLGDFAARPALFLSLHGAGVEARNQAASYAPKSWGILVAPTNRRPFGFSWEDWGRLDALEVLDLVTRKYDVEEDRVYLTGHSMGGHGTWFLGTTYPDRFAAIGPSAGWITFSSYRFAGAPEATSEVQRMLRRAAAPSDLFSLADNDRHFGVYVLHGEKDDNVPPEQSHRMIERLKPIHHDFEFFEQPGAGHWWDVSPEPGTDCVDWQPMFDFFARHARPGRDRVRAVEFTTANPGISARDAWLTIDAQERPLTLSTARLRLDPGLNRVQGSTANVARLAIDRNILNAGAPASVELDSQTVEIRWDAAPEDRIWLEKEGGSWRQSARPSPSVKGEKRYGTFKEAFRNHVALVYGTAGTAEENRWAFERARFDGEKLWYQGNASVDVLADTQFDPAKEPDRNVILYGNRRTHRLWSRLLADSPVIVDEGRLDCGRERLTGPDLCCLFVRPRPGSERASVGVVSGTGARGMALAGIVRYLEPGLGLPDLTVFSEDVVTKGDAGVLLAGFFGLDWSVTSGEFLSGR